MQTSKTPMWIYSDDPTQVEYRRIHELEIKNFPRLRTILQGGWIATSLGVVTSLISSANGSVVIPIWVSSCIAIILLISAHSILNTTYITALKAAIIRQQNAYGLFFPPILIALTLFFIDWTGSREILENFTYKAATKDLNESVYSSRSNEIRSSFSRDSMMKVNLFKSTIASKTAANKVEIARLNRLPQKNANETAWIQKLLAKEQSEVARIEAKYQDKLLSAIQTAANNRDVALQNIYSERSNELNSISKFNNSELDKESEGIVAAKSNGWVIALFFLIAYSIISWRIELVRHKGGMTKDSTETAIDAYGGKLAYTGFIFNQIVNIKWFSILKAIVKRVGADKEIEVYGVKQNVFLSTQNTPSFQNTTIANAANEPKTPIGFRRYDTNNDENTVITPKTVENVLDKTQETVLDKTVKNTDDRPVITPIVLKTEGERFKELKQRISTRSSHVDKIGKGRTAKSIIDDLETCLFEIKHLRINEEFEQERIASILKGEEAIKLARATQKEVNNG